MSLFDNAFATAKNLAKELGNGGIPAVHCGGKIRGKDFEATCTRSIRGCDPLVLCSWEEVNHKGTDTPNELGFIPDPSYRYDIHAVHLHGYPTQKAEAITLHSDDLGILPKILRNCRERVEENIMKNEKAKTIVGDISAPVYLYLGESGGGRDRRIKLEGATTFDKMLGLYGAGTYVSIGPVEGSRAWNKLDKEDQGDYRILQARAKKKTTYKAMGDFLSDMCSANECFLFAIRQGDDAVWVNPHILKELLDTPWRGADSAWLDKVAESREYWAKVVAARDAGKDYSKIKPENRNEDHGSELRTVIDAVELADSITKAGRPFYIDTDHEVENGLDVWAVNSKTGEDYPRSWRVMNDLSVDIFNTDKNGNSDLIDEKSFADVQELFKWLSTEFNNLAGKRESDDSDDAWDDDQYMEWALGDIGSLVEKCRASIENALKEKHPNIVLTWNNDTKADDISVQRGRDWSDTRVTLKETAKLKVPVEYDPLEGTEAEREIDSIADILGGIQFDTHRQSLRQKGDLEDPEVLFDDADFEEKAIVIPLTFTYTYHFEDSAY